MYTWWPVRDNTTSGQSRRRRQRARHQSFHQLFRPSCGTASICLCSYRIHRRCHLPRSCESILLGYWSRLGPRLLNVVLGPMGRSEHRLCRRRRQTGRLLFWIVLGGRGGWIVSKGNRYTVRRRLSRRRGISRGPIHALPLHLSQHFQHRSRTQSGDRVATNIFSMHRPGEAERQTRGPCI